MDLKRLKEIINKMEKFISDINDLINAFNCSRSHILSNMELFSPKELQCMAMDGIIDYSEIPTELRTEHVKFMAKINKDKEVKKDEKN